MRGSVTGERLCGGGMIVGVCGGATSGCSVAGFFEREGVEGVRGLSRAVCCQRDCGSLASVVSIVEVEDCCCCWVVWVS